MTRLLFAGHHTCPINNVNRPFTLSLSDKVIRFNDYENDRSMLVYAVPMIHPFAPAYRRGFSNDQQPYESLDWSASEAWFDTRTAEWHFSRVQLQTWDRETFYLWAKWPHRRYNNRIWPIEFTAEQVIFTLNTASCVRLLRFIDSLKHQQEHDDG